MRLIRWGMAGSPTSSSYASSRRCLRLTALAPLAVACGISLSALEPKNQIPFLGNQRNSDADLELLTHLNQRLGVTMRHDKSFDYGALIHKLVETYKDGPYLAHVTPYAYVAAKMMGARFEVLATYQSAATKGNTTYHSYFVVNRESFSSESLSCPNNGPSLSCPPNLESDLTEYLRKKRRRFIFHDKFSTSSYFLPALWFHSHGVFAMAQSTPRLIAIQVGRQEGTSEDLVVSVAEGTAQLAAVWDGTKAEFENAQDEKLYAIGKKVFFIQLPDTLPNDLLVSSAGLDSEMKKRAVDAIKSGIPINKGDFEKWIPIQAARDARDALDDLVLNGAQPVAPVTVSVYAPPKYREQVQEAVRLSGSEFALYYANPGDPEQSDVKWSLREIHDGAVELTTSVQDPGFEEMTQTFRISLTRAEGDLTSRILTLVRSRMHRVRYIWPYEERYPTVIRDFEFSIEPGAILKVQGIHWIDPKHNVFSPDTPGTATVDKVYPSRLTLKSDVLKEFDDPMSNSAFRVVLVRPSLESLMAKVMTGAFLGALVLAAIGAGLDLRRKPRPSAPPVARTTVDGACTELVSGYHDPWRGRELAEADVLWCDRDQVEKLIEELKIQGVALELGVTERRQRSWRASAMLSYKGLGGGVDQTRSTDLVIDRAKVGDATRLAALLKLMVERRLFSAFVGRPVEGEALNRIARSAFKSEDQSETGPAEIELLRTDNDLIAGLMSKHFNQVLEDSRQKVSFFRGAWTTAKQRDRQIATQRVPFSYTLRVGADRREVRGLILEFDLPAGKDMPVTRGTPVLDCWLLGKVVRLSYTTREASQWLCLNFRAMAGVAETGAGPPAGGGGLKLRAGVTGVAGRTN